jgi:hypothetical protein
MSKRRRGSHSADFKGRLALEIDTWPARKIGSPNRAHSDDQRWQRAEPDAPGRTARSVAHLAVLKARATVAARSGTDFSRSMSCSWCSPLPAAACCVFCWDAQASWSGRRHIAMLMREMGIKALSPIALS